MDNTMLKTIEKYRSNALGTTTSKKNVIAWILYDFGASAFPTSVITVLFGPFITSLAKNSADAHGFVYPFGIGILAGSFYPYVISFSVLLQVIFLPLLGAVADYSGKKKQMLAFSAYFGSLMLILMLTLDDSSYFLGGAMFIAANISFGASLVFYNAFLPSVCPEKERNFVSSLGWGFGYAGGGLLLLLQFIFLENANHFNLEEMTAARVALASCGLWWAIFATITLTLIRIPPLSSKKIASFRNVVNSAAQLTTTIKSILKLKHTFLFLIAFLLYSDGIQTLTSISTQFGQEELGLSISTLAKVILIVQFVGFFGAFLCNKIASFIGAKKTIILTLTVYICVLLFSYTSMKTVNDFYIMAFVIGLVIVGSQALSRSVFSLMIPEGKESEYFGIYQISERGTSWLGPLFFGIALQFTGSYRLAILMLAIYFIAGIVLLVMVNFKKAVLEAKNA